MNWGAVKKVNSDLTTPLNEGGIKVVKSVQRGVGATTDECLGSGLIINISPVDLEKSICLGAVRAGSIRVSFSKSDAIRIVSDENNVDFYWQVVEFY